MQLATCDHERIPLIVKESYMRQSLPESSLIAPKEATVTINDYNDKVHYITYSHTSLPG